jgi:hypothetical protein
MMVRTAGLGSQQSWQQAVQYGSVGASAAAGAAFAAHLIPASAVPFIGPAIAGVALLASALIKNSGCGQTCIVTSQWANQAQDALKQNIDAYFAQPVRTRASQKLALQTFDQIWSRLTEMCGDPQWGDAGKRCISDRQRGACVWHATENSQWPGGVQLGQCWNWFSGLRDPIANDTGVVEDAAVDSSVLAGSVLVGGSSVPVLPLALIGGLVLLAVAL